METKQADQFKKWVLKEETPKTPEFKEGEIYWSNCPGIYDKGYIFKFKKMLMDGFLVVYYCISVGEDKFGTDHGINDNHWKNLRLATPEERQWLESCAKAGKFLPQKSDEAPNPNTTEQWTPKVGEWVVIKDTGFNNSTHKWYKSENCITSKGGVYQVEDRDVNAKYGSAFTIKINDTAYGSAYVRKALPHEIPVTSTELGYLSGITGSSTPSPTNESLLEEAKRRYPVGTKFKCLVTRAEYVVPEGISFKNEDGNIYSYVNNGIWHKHYDGERWAEIIEEPKTVGLEVSANFSVGDWVTMDRWTSKPTVEQIVRIENGTAYIGRDRSVHLAFEKELRKATPEEIAKATSGSILAGNCTGSVGVIRNSDGSSNYYSNSVTKMPYHQVEQLCGIKFAEPVDLRFDGGNIFYKKSGENIQRLQPSPKILVKSHEEFKITVTKPKQIKL